MPADTPPVIIEPPQRASACVVWLHGLGADGHDFEPVVPHLGAIIAHTRFIFPHAPMRPVTINGGAVMRAWYDIVAMRIERRADAAGVHDSQQRVAALLDAQVHAGIPAARIVLAGFSQGGAIALHTGLRYAQRLAGIMALSTYVALPEDSASEVSAANADVPIFMAHGVQDPVVPLELAERSREHLRELGYTPQWHSYPMPHSVSAAELDDIAAWLGQQLA